MTERSFDIKVFFKRIVTGKSKLSIRRNLFSPLEDLQSCSFIVILLFNKSSKKTSKSDHSRKVIDGWLILKWLISFHVGSFFILKQELIIAMNRIWDKTFLHEKCYLNENIEIQCARSSRTLMQFCSFGSFNKILSLSSLSPSCEERTLWTKGSEFFSCEKEKIGALETFKRYVVMISLLV